MIKNTKVTTTKYIGDGVYATFNGYGITLTTGSHVVEEADLVIHLESETISDLVEFIKDMNSTGAS